MKNFFKLKKNKVFSIAILLIGVLTAVFISSRPPKSVSDTLKAETSSGRRSNLAFTKGLEFETNNPVASNEGNESEKSKENLTASLAESYVEQILRLNPDGVQNKGGDTSFAIPSEDAFAKLLQNKLEAGFVFKKFGERDIKISKDGSKIAELRYGESVRQVLETRKKNFENELTALNDFFTKQKMNGFEKYLFALEDQIGKLLAIPVPPQSKLFHLELLNVWQKQAAIYEAFLNLAEDPLKALLAINEFSNTLQELRAVNIAFQERFGELKS